MRSNSQQGVCGSIFFHDVNAPEDARLIPKQLNVFSAARDATSALEIGFNAGHSAALMLLANSTLTVRAFDTCHLAYTRPCVDFLNGTFGNRITLIEGASQLTLPTDREQDFDLLHVDADHMLEAVIQDLQNALPKCSDGATVILDDWEESNEIGRKAQIRTDLVPTSAYTLHPVEVGSSHGIFRYRKGDSLI